MGDIVSHLSVAIVSAGLVPILQYFLQKTKVVGAEARSDFKMVVEHLQREADRLSADNDEMRGRITQLETILKDEIPYPMWAKDRSGRYQWVNAAFTSEILDPIAKHPRDVIGKMDSEVFAPEVAKRLQVLLEKAIRSSDKRAYAPVLKFEDASDREFTVVKWPFFVSSVCVGFRGMALPRS